MSGELTIEEVMEKIAIDLMIEDGITVTDQVTREYLLYSAISMDTMRKFATRLDECGSLVEQDLKAGTKYEAVLESLFGELHKIRVELHDGIDAAKSDQIAIIENTYPELEPKSFSLLISGSFSDKKPLTLTVVNIKDKRTTH